MALVRVRGLQLVDVVSKNYAHCFGTKPIMHALLAFIDRGMKAAAPHEPDSHEQKMLATGALVSQLFILT